MTFLEEYGYLINWFNVEYAKLEQKYRRLNTLFNINILTTDEAKNAYSNLIALYNEAEEKRKRIQYLEAVLNVKN